MKDSLLGPSVGLGVLALRALAPRGLAPRIGDGPGGDVISAERPARAVEARRSGRACFGVIFARPAGIPAEPSAYWQETDWGTYALACAMMSFMTFLVPDEGPPMAGS